MTALPDHDRPHILTIGHSTHSFDHFLALLRAAGVTAIADVRSAPYSRRAAQFNRETLAASLRQAGLAYVHLGRELGGRPADPTLYQNGVVDYERVAATPVFTGGVDRLIAGTRGHRIAVMCAERDPLQCHRCLLISRRLRERDVAVSHILADGALLPHTAVETRLLAEAGLTAEDMFEAPADRLARAYRAHAPRGPAALGP